MRTFFFLCFVLYALHAAGQRQVDLEKVQWIHGAADCHGNSDPNIQVVQFDNSTWIFRQNKCDHYEAPFMYLFIGTTEAMLVDTGATTAREYFPLYDTVARIVSARAIQPGRPLLLTVIHTHSHGDHIAADYQFRNRKDVKVVGPTRDSIAAFLKIDRWPEQNAIFNLGHRRLTFIPIPGHDQASIAIYDEQTQWLLTGDTVYPGRLYVRDWPAFKSSISRLVAFSEKNKVSWLMGNHIEMSKTKGIDYPVGTKFQPDEHILPMKPGVLGELAKACVRMGDHPMKKVHDDFIIVPVK